MSGQLPFASSSSFRLFFLRGKIKVVNTEGGTWLKIKHPLLLQPENNGTTFSDMSDPFSSSWLSLLETLPAKDKGMRND